jgi:hypothetical protein
MNPKTPAPVQTRELLNRSERSRNRRDKEKRPTMRMVAVTLAF